MVVRYQGGHNAGSHHRGRRREVRPPARAQRRACIPHTTAVIGNGVVVDPAVLLDEIDRLTARGIDCSRLRISGNAHLIMPYHQEIDALTERRSARTSSARPSAASVRRTPTRRRASACACRTCTDPKIFREKLEVVLKEKNQILAKIFNRLPLSIDALCNKYLDEYAPRIAPMIVRLGVARARSARARREHPARRRPGHVPRPRPRHVSVRHVVEPGRGRRLHGRGHRPTRHHPHRRHRQALHHPGRRRTVPDRDPRRTGRRPHRARRRVRHQHRSASPRRLVRRGDDAPGRAPQLADRTGAGPSSTCSTRSTP